MGYRFLYCICPSIFGRLNQQPARDLAKQSDTKEISTQYILLHEEISILNKIFDLSTFISTEETYNPPSSVEYKGNDRDNIPLLQTGTIAAIAYEPYKPLSIIIKTTNGYENVLNDIQPSLGLMRDITKTEDEKTKINSKIRSSNQTPVPHNIKIATTKTSKTNNN